MRLFVSVDLPDALAPAVADVQGAFADASGLSFTDPEQAHITLKFLGEVDSDRVPELEAALETAVDESGVTPFPVTYGGLGVFPDLSYISVLWLGVIEGGEELTHLHEAIETRTTALGFDPESHDFTPHVTLARMEHAGGKELVQDLVTDWEPIESDALAAQYPGERGPVVGETTIEAVRLTESTLGPDGPVYETVTTISLG
ncbi:2'-5' RNA ligase [Halovivax ruber XH-70]|uniref:RNA 2',3'-cyclic phosphodiesterase n=1 Tax=Halovivax ruber (strain DSM 18193 / JCM 13892 / XH-70) TaxID=797302 RepID=L0I864_HALRX|nr:RNA 2',3'-cyclic phosphodiesterase [Halovivax ruber]AGB14988.1 2'-5' RNA ligase [Halovivax ruber XH-70]